MDYIYSQKEIFWFNIQLRAPSLYRILAAIGYRCCCARQAPMHAGCAQFFAVDALRLTRLVGRNKIDLTANPANCYYSME
jgi:hypothetical protein